MASARPRTQDQAGKLTVTKKTLNQSSSKIDVIIKNIISRQSFEHENDDQKWKEIYKTIIDAHFNKVPIIKDKLWSHYTNDTTTFKNISNLLTLMGLALECPDTDFSKVKKTDDQFHFCRQYYTAIMNVYTNSNTPNSENLYDFIMRYFASVCPPSS
jgi:hypothetical protein